MRILLIDDEGRVRSALRCLIEQAVSGGLVSEVAQADELGPALRGSQPDVVLVDWEFAGKPGEALTSQIREICPGARIIALSCKAEARKAALLAGAAGFISKNDPPERVLEVIRGTDRAAPRRKLIWRAWYCA